MTEAEAEAEETRAIENRVRALAAFAKSAHCKEVMACLRESSYHGQGPFDAAMTEIADRKLQGVSAETLARYIEGRQSLVLILEQQLESAKRWQKAKK